MVWCDIVWCDMVQCGMIWYSMVCDMVWYGVLLAWMSVEFVNTFSAWYDYVVLFLWYVNRVNCIDWFLNTEAVCIPRINPVWSRCIIHLCIILFSLVIYIEDFLHLCSWGILDHDFLVLSLSDLGVRIMPIW